MADIAAFTQRNGRQAFLAGKNRICNVAALVDAERCQRRTTGESVLCDIAAGADINRFQRRGPLKRILVDIPAGADGDRLQIAHRSNRKCTIADISAGDNLNLAQTCRSERMIFNVTALFDFKFYGIRLEGIERIRSNCRIFIAIYNNFFYL